MGQSQLLFLSQTLPYPPDGGVKIRTYHILKLLARQFDIHALCFHRQAARPSGQDVDSCIEELEKYASVEAFDIPQEASRSRFVWDHARSVIGSEPYTRFTYQARNYGRRLDELLDTHDYDIIHVDSLDLSYYMPRIIGNTVICGHHNVESELLSRRADKVDSTVKAMYLRHQARLLEKEERRWCSQVSLNVTVSERDRDVLTERIPEAEAFVVPNGVDVDSYRPSEGETDGIVFVGGCTWFPNRDALTYFSRDILPRVRQRQPEVSVRWVGRADPEVRREYQNRHGIEMPGYVEDIRPYVHLSSCYVVPIRVGGGSRLKILDAWAMGKAVVSTSQGCEGLDARDGENILVRDEPDAFADAVNRVLMDAELRDELGRNARRTAEEVYSWEVIGAEMNATYEELASTVR